MNSTNKDQDIRDPFGLGDLPLLEPDRDGWAQVQASLEADRTGLRNRRLGIGLAMAACLVVAVGLVVRQPAPSPAGPEPVLTAQQTEMPGTEPGDRAGAEPLQQLIGMSQVLEQRLRLLRNQTSTMPSESAVYVTELEDLVARVDGQLSMQPESLDLWTQRVNLMLDLEYLFQHQFEREYGRMASL